MNEIAELKSALSQKGIALEKVTAERDALLRKLEDERKGHEVTRQETRIADSLLTEAYRLLESTG
jgi:hypothetical protein